MTYTVCPNCGQKALNVATRCPHCGVPFEAQFFQYSATVPKRKRVPRGLLIAGAVIAVLGVNAVWQLITTTRRPPPAKPLVSAPLPEPATQPRGKSTIPAAESRDTALSPSLELASESLPPNPDGAGLAVPSAPDAGDTVTTIIGQRRYASTWTNVRAGRSRTAPVLRILRPGEVVRVDSLHQGWYRLVSGPQPLGYVDRRLLDSSPPTSP